MALTWLPVLLTCIGGALACMTDQGCANLNTQSLSALTANNLTEYCRIRSRTIACYAFDTTGCPNPDDVLTPMYTGYYNTCSLTASDVETCKTQITSCSSLLSAALTPLSNTNIAGYCSAMEPYLTCVKNSITGCNNKVTVYDVLGPVHGTYDKFCSTVNNNDKTQACQGHIFSAGCQNSLSDITDALTAQDLSQYCRLMDTYMTCFDQAFSNCDPSLSKDTFMSGMGQTYNQLCTGPPLQACQLKTYSCYSSLGEADNSTGNPTLQCSGIKNYLDCVNEQMKTCDPSVKRSDIIGPMEASFNILCGGTDGGYCPGVSTCMQTLMSVPSSSTTQQPNAPQGGPPSMVPENPDIMQDCSKLGAMMKCMDTELGKCNATSARSYTLKDVGELFVTGCLRLTSNTKLLTCSQMNTCMSTLAFPTDIEEISRLYYDPQFWCSILKSTMVCAESSTQCQADRSEIKEFLGEVNQVCPEAQLRVTVSGNDGHVIRAGMLTTLNVISVILLSRQL